MHDSLQYTRTALAVQEPRELHQSIADKHADEHADEHAGKQQASKEGRGGAKPYGIIAQTIEEKRE
jgi:hypothetical protein